MINIVEKNHIENNLLDNLSHNLIKLLKRHHINEADLATKLNITYNTLHRLVSGTTSDPKISTLKQIADFFNISLDTLLNDTSAELKTHDDAPRFVPILSWDDMHTPHIFHGKNLENWTKWIPVATVEKNIMNEKCYALESTRSMQPKFPLGTTFIIKPDESPIDGDLVIVKFKSDESVTLRELIIDSPHWQLSPIIPGSKSLILNKNEMEIIGVVILTVIQTRNT